MGLFSSPLTRFFFFFDQQQQQQSKKNKGDLNADELPALFVHSHCTHSAALPPPQMSRPHQRCCEQSRSRWEICRIRADGKRDQRTKPWPHAHDRKFGRSFVVDTFEKPEEKIPAGAVELTGWKAALLSGDTIQPIILMRYIYFFLIRFAGRNNPHAFQSVRKKCVHVTISIPLARERERQLGMGNTEISLAFKQRAR